MKTTRVTGTAHVGMAPPAPVSYLRNAAQRVVVDTTPLLLQQALAQIEELQRAVGSSQLESIAAYRQVALLTETNARLTVLAVQHEQEAMKVRQFAYHDQLAGQRVVDDEKRAPDVAHKVRDQFAKPHRVDDPSPGATARLGVVPREVARAAPQCPTWKLTDLCLFEGLDPESMRHLAQLLTKRARFRKGEVVYRVGDGFDALYAVRTGSCKTVLLARDGQDQVAGYHMAGEIIGMDGIGTDIHECQATALEDMDVCPLPFDKIENLARLSDPFQHNLHKLLSQESARARTLMIVLGTMRAEQRLAVFLLDLSRRYRARGYSSCEFVLRMTREEIGSYLGLKLETVSRLFSRFQREGLIQVEGRAVKLLDPVAVNQLVDCGA